MARAKKKEVAEEVAEVEGWVLAEEVQVTPRTAVTTYTNGAFIMTVTVSTALTGSETSSVAIIKS